MLLCQSLEHCCSGHLSREWTSWPQGSSICSVQHHCSREFIHFSSSQSCLLMDIFQILHSLSVMHAVLHCLGYRANSKELQASKQDWVPTVCFSLHLIGPCTACWPCSFSHLLHLLDCRVTLETKPVCFQKLQAAGVGRVRVTLPAWDQAVDEHCKVTVSNHLLSKLRFNGMKSSVWFCKGSCPMWEQED